MLNLEWKLYQLEIHVIPTPMETPDNVMIGKLIGQFRTYKDC